MNADGADNKRGGGEGERIDAAGLTWAVLLSRWVDFARSAVALPDAGDDGRLKASVTDLIALQAVWFALRQVDELPPEQRALGLDRAEVLIDRHAKALRRRWKGGNLPQACADLIDDATTALSDAKASHRA